MKRRLLFLSHRVPFPPHSGAAIRTYNLLRELSKDFVIDALCFHRLDPATSELTMTSRVAALSSFANCEVFAIPQQTSRVRLVWDHLRSVVMRRAYTWYLHESAGYRRRLEELLHEHDYAAIHVDSLDLVRYLEILPPHLVACTHHNVESALLDRRSRRESRTHRRLYLALQARFLRRTEAEWAPRVALNLCMSSDDAEALQQHASGARTVIVPNGVDHEFFAPRVVERAAGLVFVGGTSWYPNRDALHWFTKVILPQLRADGVTCPVTWVGRVSEAERDEYAQVPGFTMTGYVPDVRPYLATAVAFVAPIRVGGGTRLKILDAWAMGTPMIATGAAMEGLEARAGQNFLPAESASEFSSAVRRLLSDHAFAARLGHCGRKTVEQAYSWRQIGEDLRRLYRSLPFVPETRT